MSDHTTPDASWDIDDNGGLIDTVRSETGYDESRLPTDALSSIIKSAKRELALRAGVESFYDDRAITMALQGLVEAKAKGRVENSPLSVKNIGPEDVTLRVPDGSELQVAQYEEMIQLGLAEANTDRGGPEPLRVTNAYFNDENLRSG